jgi:DNA-binding transcriptional LysR family regulator
MTTPRPDLDDLELLTVVAETGSLGRAARRLGISQPSVSRRMGRLEATLRLELLDRGHRGTLLTPTGRVVVGWAHHLLDAAGEFTESVDALLQHRSISLRAAASMTIAEHLAPSWLSRLREHDPDAVVSLSVHNSTEVVALVEEGRVDVGFVESPSRLSSPLKKRRIGWDALKVVVSPEHAWARARRPITPRALVEQPLLVREEGSGTRETIDRALARHGLVLTPSLMLASNAALKSSALVSLAPAVLSELAVSGELRSGQLVAVDVADLDLRRPLSVVWREDRRLPGPAEALIRLAAVPRVARA